MTIRSKSIITVMVPKMRFLREQSGPSETLLKERLSRAFSSGRLIRRAYLLRVAYENSPATKGVVLAMRTSTDQEETTVVDIVGAAFASIFGAQEHLDMLFVQDEQEKAIREVCPAFYCATEDGASVH